ncbi:MAG: twin-arginine translocase TatA/TatE family subunit [bacterium]
MGNLGFGEIVLIALVALILFGPKKLPELGKALGKGFHDFKKALEGKSEEAPAPPEEKIS